MKAEKKENKNTNARIQNARKMETEEVTGRKQSTKIKCQNNKMPFGIDAIQFYYAHEKDDRNV